MRQVRIPDTVAHRFLVALLLGALGLMWPAGSACTKEPSVAATIPAGTVLYLRLQTPVSTKTSKEGQSVTALVARPAEVQGGVAIPPGATVSGKIEKCSQSDRPDQRAQLLLLFQKIDIPGEGSLDLKGHISGIPNARESLLADGTIVGLLQTDTPAALLNGVLAKIGTQSPDLQKEIEKEKIGQVNTAIEYGQGTDLQFTLSEAVGVRQLFASAPAKRLSAALVASFESVLATAPQRSVAKENKPGDPINLVFAGTTENIGQAFRAAGWAEPKGKNGQSIFDTARAVINGDGYGVAPVSDLYLYGRKEDLAFEKVLNTFNKRHHLRLWMTTARTRDGRPIWLGAATHDVGIDVHPGVVSHATDPNLDDERDQIEADLSGDAVQGMELIRPPNPLTSGNTATGGAWHTDGRLLAIDFKPTASPGSP
jgi:hypothetical protein